MARSRDSSVSSSKSSSSHTDVAYEFLVKQLKASGSMTLQNLLGKLLTSSHNVRRSVGSSKYDLRSYLRKFPDTFSFETNGSVSLRSSDSGSGQRECPSSSGHALFPEKLTDGRGKITFVSSVYGFMKSLSPIETHVYFSVQSFGDPEKTLMAQHCVRRDQKLGFNAVKGPPNCEARYRATRVWHLDKSDDEEDVEEEDNPVVRKNYERTSRNVEVSKGRTTFRPTKSIHNNKTVDLKTKELAADDHKTEGIIENIFETYGFITIVAEPDQHVFFHEKKVINKSRNARLLDIVKKGDTVEFEAIHSSKSHGRVQWEATSVWIKQHIESGTTSSNEEEIFISSEEVSDSDGNHAVSCRRKSYNNKKAVPALSAKLKSFHESCCSRSKAKGNGNFENGYWNEEQCKNLDASSVLSSCPGKIYPNSGNRAVVKFGPSYEYEVIVDTSVAYMNGARVQDISWEFAEGQTVYFDAAKVSDPSRWKTVLMWSGQKPVLSALSSPPSSVTSNLTEDDEFKESEPCSLNEADVFRSTETSEECKMKNTDWGDSPYPSEIIDNYLNENDCVRTSATYNSTTELNGLVKCVSNNSSSALKTVKRETKETSSSSCEATGAGKSAARNDSSGLQTMGKKPKESCAENHSFEEVKRASASCEATCNQQTCAITPFASNNSIKNKESGVFMFRGICGTVSRLYRSYVELKCKELEKSVSFFWTTYYDYGTLVSEKYSDIREALELNCTVNLNCFYIVDDKGGKWSKATLVWKGEEPAGIKEMEPQEFIDGEELAVSCSVPTWESFLKTPALNESLIHQNSVKSGSSVDESMRLLNSNDFDNDASISDDGDEGSSDSSHCNNLPSEQVAAEKASYIPEVIETISNTLLSHVDDLRNKKRERLKILNHLEADIISYRKQLSTLFANLASHQSVEHCRNSDEDLNSTNVQCQRVSTETQTIVTGKVISDQIYHL